jgi:hypothetical protein
MLIFNASPKNQKAGSIRSGFFRWHYRDFWQLGAKLAPYRGMVRWFFQPARRPINPNIFKSVKRFW